MTEMARCELQVFACQSTGPTPISPSTQLIMPKSRPNIWVNTMVTATIEVMFGSSTPIRRLVRARSRWLSRCAIQSAASSCGTVDSTQMLSVLPSAFQKYGSCSSSR